MDSVIETLTLQDMSQQAFTTSADMRSENESSEEDFEIVPESRPAPSSVLDFSDVPMDAKSARYQILVHSDREKTKSLSLRAPYSPRMYKGDYDDCDSERSAPKCLTSEVIEVILNQCPALERFSISYEQLTKVNLIHSISFCSLTHLSLKYCRVSSHTLALITTAEFPLKRLEVLDLTGVEIDTYLPGTQAEAVPKRFKEMVHPPASLKHLMVSDWSHEMSMHYNYAIKLTSLTSLIRLDFSLMHISYVMLLEFSKSLQLLNSLNLCDSLLMYPNADETDRRMTAAEWGSIWIYGFPLLRRLNAGNVRQTSGSFAPSLFKLISVDVEHVIDTDGTAKGEWNEEELIVPSYDKWSVTFKCCTENRKLK